jgi:hypothetical protein
MSDFITKEYRQEYDQQQQFDAEQERGLGAIYKAYPSIKPCMATKSLVIDLVRTFLGDDGTLPVTLENFRSMLEQNPDALNTLVIESPQKQNEALIGEICELLRSADGTGRGGKFSDAALKSERHKMLWWTRDQLQQRLNQIVEAQRLAKLPAAQIKADLAAARRDVRPYTGYPTLPKTIVPRGQVTAVVCDSKYLQSLHPEDLRRMSRLYSQQQINDRLNNLS